MSDTNPQIVPPLSKEPLPIYFSWRVTNPDMFHEVFDQGQLFICHTVTACELIEFQFYIKKGVKIRLSKQFLIQHVKPHLEHYAPDECGCYGSPLPDLFSLIINNGGICLEKDLPYLGRRDAYLSDYEIEDLVKIRDYTHLFEDQSDETCMMALVDKHPVGATIIIDANIFEKICGTEKKVYMGYGKISKRKHNAHIVSITGYGTTDGTDGDRCVNYWEFRNSYGPDWGDKGYGKLCRRSSYKPPTTLPTSEDPPTSEDEEDPPTSEDKEDKKPEDEADNYFITEFCYPTLE